MPYMPIIVPIHSSSVPMTNHEVGICLLGITGTVIYLCFLCWICFIIAVSFDKEGLALLVLIAGLILPFIIGGLTLL